MLRSLSENQMTALFWVIPALAGMTQLRNIRDETGKMVTRFPFLFTDKPGFVKAGLAHTMAKLYPPTGIMEFGIKGFAPLPEILLTKRLKNQISGNAGFLSGIFSQPLTGNRSP